MNYNLTTIQECQTDKYEVMISASLFKMIDSYKDFEKEYVNKFLKWFEFVPKESYVRLYVDGSVLQEPSFVSILDKQHKNLEIIFYEFKDFIRTDINDLYHDGTFGTIVRFLPLYSKFRPRNIKYVWISDLDMPVTIFNYKYINIMKKNNIKVTFYSKGCYDKPWADKKIKYPIGVGRMIVDTSAVRLNFLDYIKFLNDVLDHKYKKVFDDIVNHYKNYREIKDVKYFPYGFDELFANTYLTKAFSKYRRCIIFEISLTVPFQKYLDKKELKDSKGLYFASQEYDRPMSTKSKQILIELNDGIYEKIKNEKLDNLGKLCKRDYEENRKFLDSKEVGVVSVVFKNPGEY